MKNFMELQFWLAKAIFLVSFEIGQEGQLKYTLKILFSFFHINLTDWEG